MRNSLKKFHYMKDAIEQEDMEKFKHITQCYCVNRAIMDGENEMNTPLLYTMLQDKTEMIRFLLENGANPNITNLKKEIYPLDFAVRNGRREMITMLLEYGAELDQLDPAVYDGLEKETMKVILQYVDKKWKEQNKGDNKRIVLSKEEWEHVLSLYKIVQQKNYTGLGSLEVVSNIQKNIKTKENQKEEVLISFDAKTMKVFERWCEIGLQGMKRKEFVVLKEKIKKQRPKICI